jgi:PXPV repeat (3 copies)
MPFHRAILVASATLFALVISPAAFAGCGGCGFGPPVYAQPAPVYVQPAPVYAIPAPLPPPAAVAPAPIAVDHWDTGGCGTLGGCGGGCGFGGCGFNSFIGFNSCNCGRAVGYAPSPLYVVNQGPEYSGPGMMVPYQSYSPGAAFAPAINYPYVAPRYGYRGPGYFPHRFYRGPRYAFRARVYVHPRYFRARPYLYR